jgi:hypothetical protein
MLLSQQMACSFPAAALWYTQVSRSSREDTKHCSRTHDVKTPTHLQGDLKVYGS